MARRAVLPSDLSELVADERSELLGVVQDLGELGDGRFQLVPFRLELDPTEAREPAERHLENVIRLGLR